VRAIERGARIVTASEMRVVLQMPRGNLEGIYPRFIMMQELISLIEKKEYLKAFKICR
jgi:elongator complex protein 1